MGTCRCSCLGVVERDVALLKLSISLSSCRSTQEYNYQAAASLKSVEQAVHEKGIRSCLFYHGAVMGGQGKRHPLQEGGRTLREEGRGTFDVDAHDNSVPRRMPI